MKVLVKQKNVSTGNYKDDNTSYSPVILYSLTQLGTHNLTRKEGATTMLIGYYNPKKDLYN